MRGTRLCSKLRSTVLERHQHFPVLRDHAPDELISFSGAEWRCLFRPDHRPLLRGGQALDFLKRQPTFFRVIHSRIIRLVASYLNQRKH